MSEEPGEEFADARDEDDLGENQADGVFEDGDDEIKPSIGKLVAGAIGVVFGDIGTSPLYTMHEAFRGAHTVSADHTNVMGLVSLVVWSLLIVVTLKYVLFVMRADNHGEGGILALLTLARRGGPFGIGMVTAIGIAGAALFYGDSIITPAMSVLSAVEGITVVAPQLDYVVVPVAVVILIGLFTVQRRGTAHVGALFGPVMILWFAVIAVLGIIQLVQNPMVLEAINPIYAVRFFIADGFRAFAILGAVVLAITGGEALYADMGHFGKRPIQLSWLCFVLPCLLLCYLGQAALILSEPSVVDNPFFRMAPDWFLIPLVVLATAATVIASQAVITGAYSVTRQAIQLGIFPRTRIWHTSEKHIGQIYLPAVNWMLLIGVLMLVLSFHSSTNLAAAYGIAVTGTMTMTTLLLFNVVTNLWRWNIWLASMVLLVWLTIDLAFFGANLLKVADGGWLPLAVGALIYLIMSTWHRGRAVVTRHFEAEDQPLGTFIRRMRGGDKQRVPGTAVYLTSRVDRVPQALQLNLKHNKVMHERIIVLSLVTVAEPRVSRSQSITIEEIIPNVLKIEARFGFMQHPSVPRVMRDCERMGVRVDEGGISYLLSRIIPVPTQKRSMSFWRERLFVVIAQNATSAAEFFRLPPEQTIELGERVSI